MKTDSFDGYLGPLTDSTCTPEDDGKSEFVRVTFIERNGVREEMIPRAQWESFMDEGTDGSGAAAAWCFIGALLTVLAAVAWAVLA